MKSKIFEKIANGYKKSFIGIPLVGMMGNIAIMLIFLLIYFKEKNLLLLIIGLFLNIIVLAIYIYIYFSNQKLSQKLYKTAYIDAITDLGNEIYFKENGLNLIKSTNKNRYIIIFDINKFKTFNNLYSYDFCNKILKEVGRKIAVLFEDKCILSRISMDYFGLCFIYRGEIEKIIEKMCKAVENLKVEEDILHINLAIGCYKIKDEDEDINKVLNKAYLAHKKSKGIYEKNYYIFDENLEKKLIEEESLEANMQNALQNNEFKVVYQPKIYVKDESLAGAEALIRWQQGKNIIMPNKFIPLFEKNNFILQLDLHIFELVCKDIKRWQKEYKEVPLIAVNVSKSHFMNENFIDEYVAIADKYGIDKTKIELEITESATVDENIDILKIIKIIKKVGFIVSLDDFGTGYSSLSMLQNMPIDIIKIDKVFIDKADLKSDENIINDIVFIAKRLGKKTIVEGVETKQQIEFVKKIESDVVQGFYYSKPITTEEFEKYLKKD